MTAAEKAEMRRVSSHGLRVLYEKEMSDHVNSIRFMILLLLIVLTSAASVYGSASVLGQAAQEDANDIFLKLYTLSGNSIPSFTTFIALLGPFVGLALGFDSINSERSEGTLNRLASQPIYRDSIINAKFLAAAEIIFLMVFSMGIITGAVGTIRTGLVPSGEEAGRILVFLLTTSIYICFWLALAILFSAVFRHAATSAMAVIAVWLFCAMFMNMAVNLIAETVWPITAQSTPQEMLRFYNGSLMLNRLSPYYLYQEAVSTIMNPSVRAINLMMPQQMDGAIEGYLSLGQSLLLIWPHLTGLFAFTAIVFAASYILFMRSEIRSR